jgi:hypothetical protein
VNNSEVVSLFLEQKKKFALLSTGVVQKIHDEVKLVFREVPHPSGGFEWRIKSGNRRAIVQLFYDGMIFLFLQTALTQEEKTALDTSVDFVDIDDKSPDAFYDLTNPLGLDEVIKRLKRHFE